MMQQLSAKLRLWGEAIASTDDPLGEYLVNLEKRVRRLEGEVGQLRRPPSANAVTAETKSITEQPLESTHYPCPQAKDLR